MMKSSLLILTLTKSKNKINDLKSNKILAKLSVITVKKLVTIQISILNKSQKQVLVLVTSLLMILASIKAVSHDRSLF